jgi:hypothetical protein
VHDAAPHPLLTSLNFTVLASISGGYTVGSIKRAVRVTCPLRRLDVLDERPLAEVDFVNALARCPRIYADEAERIADFGARVTGLEVARAAPDPAAAAAAAPKKKK